MADLTSSFAVCLHLNVIVSGTIGCEQLNIKDYIQYKNIRLFVFRIKA